MKRLITQLGGVILAILVALPVSAQTKLKFSVVGFEQDLTDLSAQSAEYKKVDGSGSLYAIIKVTSNNPDDDLREYQFNFGSLKHIVDDQHDGELWLYVQRNAKTVTITRKGYATVTRYDLRTSIQAGKNYVMQLSATQRAVYKQMVRFTVTPPDLSAVVMVKSSKEGADEMLFGVADAVTGEVAKSLELGSYTYRVIADNYHETNGRFILDDRNALLNEKVILRPNFATVTLTVDQDAEIYVNEELKGTRTWTGTLTAGNYQVECRQENYKPSQPQYFTVKENEPLALTLTPPTPIVGTLAVTSSPLDAQISVDGADFGLTPRNFDIIIGSHTVTVSKRGYLPFSQQVDVTENQTVDVNATLDLNKTDKPKKEVTAKKSDNSESLLKRNAMYIQAGAQVGTLMGVGANVGGYIGNFNVEASFTMGLTSDKLYAISSSENINSLEELKPMCFGGRVGYGIMAGKRLRITPQVGVSAVSVKDDVIQTSALCATVGVRAEYAFSRHFGLSATGEGCFAVSKKDAFEKVAEVSSKVKGWGTGGNLRLGIYVAF